MPHFFFKHYSVSEATSQKQLIFDSHLSFAEQLNMILNKVNETIGLLLEYFEKDWDLTLNVEKNDVNDSFDNFLLNMNGMLDKHATFKKVSKYQLKLKTQSWIPAAIHKTTLVKNSLFKK